MDLKKQLTQLAQQKSGHVSADCKRGQPWRGAT